MYKLKLMNEYEFMKIFGCLEVLLALHQGTNFQYVYIHVTGVSGIIIVITTESIEADFIIKINIY